ncbi:Hydroxyproline-rich glyco family [Chlorella sorokiniana]|uniref:Hydroxyproline-rich glyco family n=1 Tax=Chlorella sorokiniana TaxID=3076 RepID=A0A2P6TTG3_CHLSO|nr:Hydroxyproline-rich glyco family [Chlorella sorokiniana]|eukprot:PRW57357.1 Hydroxyproline-rich glyco family [Chlorella sorokiniana]
MVCSAQTSWEPLPEAAQPPWQALPGPCEPHFAMQDELPPLQPDWAPPPFGEAVTLPPLPPLPSLPLLPLPLPPLEQQLLPAATVSHLLPSSSGSDRSAKLEERMERMRAKNRRAQARYREKQKVKQQQFELQYATVAAELEEARWLNAELRAAVAVQEAVRENREAVEAMLQATAEQQRAALQRRCTDACTCDAEGAASCWQLQPFQQRVALYTQVGRACEPMRQLVEHCSSGPQPRSLEPSTKQELRQRMARSMPEVVANVQSTSIADLMQEWAAFCEFAGQVTSAVDGGRLGEAEGEERVRPALEYIAVVKQLMLMHNAETYRQLLLRTRLPGESEDAATARWRQAAELAVTQAPLHGTFSGLAGQYVSLFEAGGTVEHQARSATLILHDFMCSSGRVLSPLQKARSVRCCVSSGGSGQRMAVYPDLVAITRAALDHYSLLAPQSEQ